MKKHYDSIFHLKHLHAANANDNGTAYDIVQAMMFAGQVLRDKPGLLHTIEKLKLVAKLNIPDIINNRIKELEHIAAAMA